MDLTKRPPSSIGAARPGARARSLQVVAHPLQVDAARIMLDLGAQDAALGFDYEPDGRMLLVPVACREGQLTIEIARADLDALLLCQANLAAAQQGAKVTKLDLALTQRGPRSLSVDVRVAAKKMLLGGVVRITGNVDITDDLTARVSNLNCHGEGMVGTLAAGMLAPRLRKVDGRSFPLGSFALGAIRPRDLRIASVDPSVRLVATFGT